MQTATEWLIEELIKNVNINDYIHKDFIRLSKSFEQAKEMGKQQIIDAYWGGLNGSINDYSIAKEVGSEIIDIRYGKGAEQYYAETYGSKGSDEIEFYKKELEDERNRVASSQTEISETEEYTSCPICNGTSINGFCSTPNCAYSLYEPNKDYLEMTPISPQTEISDEVIEREAENAWSDYEYEEGNLYSTTFKGGWKLAIKWYKEKLKNK